MRVKRPHARPTDDVGYLIRRATTAASLRLVSRKPWQGEPLISLALGIPAVALGVLALLTLLEFLPAPPHPMWRPMHSWEVDGKSGLRVPDKSGWLAPTIDFWIYMLVALALGICGIWFSRRSGRPLTSIIAVSIAGTLVVVGYVLLYIEA